MEMETEGAEEQLITGQQRVDSYYQELDAEMPEEMKQGFARARKYYGVLSGDLAIDGSLLGYLFATPDFSHYLQRVAIGVLEDYFEAVKAHDPLKVTQAVYFICHRPERGIIPTEAPIMPVVTGAKFPEVQTAENPDAQVLMSIHVHAPLDGTPMLTEVKRDRQVKYRDSGNYKGHLLVFSVMRRMRQESEQSGKRPEFIARPIHLSLKDNVERDVTQLLFVREQPRLETMSEAEYFKMLMNNNRRLIGAKNEDQRRRVLGEMGFNSSYFELPVEQFYGYPMLQVRQLERLIAEIADKPLERHAG